MKIDYSGIDVLVTRFGKEIAALQASAQQAKQDREDAAERARIASDRRAETAYYEGKRAGAEAARQSSAGSEDG